jgi:hypothetical protein
MGDEVPGQRQRPAAFQGAARGSWKNGCAVASAALLRLVPGGHSRGPGEGGVRTETGQRPVSIKHFLKSNLLCKYYLTCVM